MQVLGAVCEDRENGFNFLRLFAAIGILFAHCLLVVPIVNESSEILPAEFRVAADLLLAVFFVFSGFLITASLERSQNLIRFATARILRIYPALITVSLALMFLLGPLVTSLPLAAYFTSSETWYYMIRSVVLLDASASLPGVFERHPVSKIVNIPIWTLRYEVVIYAAFPIAALVFIKRSLQVRAITMALALVFLIYLQHTLQLGENHQGLHHLINFSAAFIIGSALWTFRNYVPNSAIAVAFLWALFWASAGLDASYFFGILAAGYSFIWLAFLNIAALKAYSKFGDLSYGTYVIHFPIAQVIYGLYPSLNPYLLSVATLAATLPIAAISWRYVENPALARVKSVSNLASSLLRQEQTARMGAQLTQAK